MKIFLCQMNVIPGKPEINFETIKASVAEAVAKHAELVVFPSFCLSGAMAGDLFLQQSFREKCNKFGEKIIALSKNIDIIFGNIDRENRNKVIHASAGKLAEKPLTQCSIRIDCSPFAVGLSETRLSSLGSDAKRTAKPILFVNAVGTENTGKRIFAFDGCSAAINADGSIAYQFPAFEAFSALVDVQANKVTAETDFGIALGMPQQLSSIAKIRTALVYMIRENLKRMGIKRMVIGASGGIDSAVSAALYAEALGSENVFLVNMPTKFNSDTTKNAARDLAENLGTPYMVAPISDMLDSVRESLGKCSFVRNDTPMKVEGINYENLQARTRSSSVLSTVASVLGAGVTCNGNKSEAMVGYCTLYGDTCGVMCALGDLWKTQVYALAHEINKDKEIIPRASLEIPASAELSEAMNVDEGKGDPIIYPYHDRLFAYWVERNKSLEDSLELLGRGASSFCRELGVDEALFRKHFPTDGAAAEDMAAWHRRYRGIALAKRLQFPPTLTISSHPFGGEYYEAQA